MKNTTAFILILISLGLFYTFINPEYQNIKNLQVEAADYQNVLANISAVSEKRDELLIKYQSVPPAEVARLQKVLPDNVDTVRLAVDFDSIASRYGISIKNIKAESVKNDNTATVIESGPATPYEKANVSFAFVASYDNFRKFLKDIESSLRVVEVKSLSFQATDNGLYEYQISIETYWLK